jgi:outer membrane protein assembly factor BamE
MRLFLLIVAAILVSCRQAPELPSAVSPYRIDIQQGNVVTQEMLAKLKAGMTRSQVRFALGSPLVVDAFHTDRWDYVYSFQRQGKDTERRRITVIFDEDKLIRIDGDVLPVDSTLISDRPIPRAAPAPAAVAKPAAPKPEPVKPAEAPAAKPPLVVAPAVEKPAPVASKPAAPAPEPVVVKPAVTPAPVAKREPEPVKAARPDAPARTAVTEIPVDTGKAAPAEAKKPDAASTDGSKEKPKSAGIFGRMLDKIGF